MFFLDHHVFSVWSHVRETNFFSVLQLHNNGFCAKYRIAFYF